MDNSYKENTNIRTYLISLLIGFIGMGLLIISYQNWFINPWNKLIEELGAVLIASVALAIIWDLFSRRSFLKELLSATKLSEQIIDTGLIGISPNWHGSVNWEDLINSASSIKIFFMYGRTWRNTNRAKLIEFASRANTKATIVLPDFNDQDYMTRLAIETGYETPVLIQ